MQLIPFNNEAMRVFTDRERPKTVFEAALDEPQRHDEHRIRIWYGVGGQGKTALLNELLRLITSRQSQTTIVVSVVDFYNAAHRNPVDALLNIRRELGRKRRVAFPTFDLAFDQLFKLDHPGGDISAAYPDLYGRNQNEIAEFLDGLGVHFLGVPWIGLMYKYSQHLPDRLRKWWGSRDVTRHMGELGKCTAIELRQKLPAFLGFDLQRATQEENGPRIVVMFDTYEALWRDSAQAAMQNPRTDNWVRTLVEASTGILVIIFSRDKLRWSDFDKVWKNRLDQHQHLLGGLSEEDATRFLQMAGVRPASVCERIVTSSQGLPFYLDLAVTQFEKLMASNGKVTPDDFADTPAELLHRFLDHLTDAERSELLLASYPDEVDESLFDALADSFPGMVAGVNWQRFKSHSFINLAEDERAILHSLMRDGLQALERKERAKHFRRVHSWLFERYDKECTPQQNEHLIGGSHDRALLAAARHLAEVDPERLVSWVLDTRWNVFNNGGRDLALSVVLERASNAISAHPTSPRAWEVDHHLGHIYQSMGRYEDSKRFFERARRLYDALKTKDRDPIVYATILHALADVSTSLGEDAEAEELYKDALTIYEEGDPSRYKQRHAEILFSYGLIRQAQGRTVEAEVYLRQAQHTFKSVVGDQQPEYAQFLYRLGYAHYERQLIDDAAALYREALDIYARNPGDTHPYYADTLLYLSSCIGARDRTEAECGFGKAIAVYSEAFGPEHPKLGRGLHLQARFWIGEPERRQSAISQLTSATEILKNALGNDHLWTKQAHSDLLRVQSLVLE